MGRNKSDICYLRQQNSQQLMTNQIKYIGVKDDAIVSSRTAPQNGKKPSEVKGLSGNLAFISKSATSQLCGIFYYCFLNYQNTIKKLFCSITFNFRILCFNSIKLFPLLLVVLNSAEHTRKKILLDSKSLFYLPI